jgi:hypothetical protein
MTKVRTTIYIDEKEVKALKIAAIKKGISLSDLLTNAGLASISTMKPNVKTVKLSKQPAKA